MVKSFNQDKVMGQAMTKDFPDFIVQAQFTGDEETQYYGTKLLYTLAFNNITNLWLICSHCNNIKSNKDAIAWIKAQPIFGEDLIHQLKNKGTFGEDNQIEKHSDKELPLEQIKAEASKQLPGMMAQIIENVYSKGKIKLKIPQARVKTI